MPTAAQKKKGAKVKVEEITPDALEKVINDHFGAGTMKRASDPTLQIVRIPTGLLSVDALIGGGFPRNRHNEIYGSANVGKSYLAQMLLASTQRLGGRGGYVDTEKTFDPVFAEHIGCDLETLAYHEQVHGPRCVDFTETLLRSGLYDVLVIDSIASLLPLDEYEKTMEAGSMGMEQAKLMSKALRKLTAANSKTAIIWINQTRDAVGSMFAQSVTSGGRAMGFYAGVRLEMSKVETLKKPGRVVNEKTGEIKKDAQVPYGHRVLVRARKDKTGGIAHPDAESSFVFDYRKGRHDHLEDLIYLGRVHDYIQKSGDKWWITDYEDEKCHGRPRFKKWLKKNVAVQEELEEMIREEIGSRGEEEDEG